MTVFLSQFLGSFLYLYIWEKMKTFFIVFGKKYTNYNKAIFGLGMTPVTGIIDKALWQRC